MLTMAAADEQGQGTMTTAAPVFSESPGFPNFLSRLLIAIICLPLAADSLATAIYLRALRQCAVLS
jgi:hypothetical protein